MSKVKVIKISNIFSSETKGPIQVRFYTKHLCLTGIKVYIIGPGYITKMAVMPIYPKNHKKIFFSRTVSQMTMKLDRQQKRLEPYKNHINDDPWVNLFYGKVKFVPLEF